MQRRLMLGLFADPQALAQAYPSLRTWYLTVTRIGLTDDGWIDATHQTRYVYARRADGIERVSLRETPVRNPH